MIIDVHTHVFPNNRVFFGNFLAEASRMRSTPIDLISRYDDYCATAPGVTAAICFGGKAKLAGLWVDDRDVATYVQQDPARLIGFLSIDPTQPNWEAELEYGHQVLGLQGIKLMPMYAGFFPQEARLNHLWAYAQKHGLPVLLHSGTTFVSQGWLETTLPRHIDVVARRYPEVRIIMAHLAHPYEGECAAVIGCSRTGGFIDNETEVLFAFIESHRQGGALVTSAAPYMLSAQCRKESARHGYRYPEKSCPRPSWKGY